MTELAGGTVPSAFDRVARSYDLMVALSPGYHAQLRSSARALVEALPATPGRRPRVVDLGCGTGALGAVVAHHRPDAVVHAADLDPAAVACARRNLPPDRVHEGALYDARANVAGDLDL